MIYNTELERFANDSGYRAKTLKQLRKTIDSEHDEKINALRSELYELTRKRESELVRMKTSNTAKLFDGKIVVHYDTQCIEINGSMVPFANIRGANINEIATDRTVVSSVSRTNEKSKRRPSIGKAAVGGVLFGPVGIIGGAMLGGKSNGQSTTTTTQYENTIPVCSHLGVVIDTGGFDFEIPLIESNVDMSTRKYKKAHTEAQEIIAKLQEITSSIEASIKSMTEWNEYLGQIDSQIDEKKSELQSAMDDKPDYSLPLEYRMPGYDGLDDESYLHMLDHMNMNGKIVKNPQAN